jgi:hypothetical protein
LDDGNAELRPFPARPSRSAIGRFLKYSRPT